MPNGTQVRAVRRRSLPELEAAMAIDENALDVMVRRQADLFYDAAKQVSLAISRRDAAKRRVKVTEAQVLLDIKQEAVDNDEKITLPELEARVIVAKEVNEAYGELLDLDREVGEWFALKDAYAQRNEALRDMVKLYLNSYYADRMTDEEARRMRIEHANPPPLQRRRIAANKERPR
jgi:hypothetical protein